MNFLKYGVAAAAMGVMVVGGGFVAPMMLAPRSHAADVNISDPQLIAQGRYVAHLADCAACHTAPGGKPFAGGLAMSTPIGTIYSPNITPDKTTGIGGSGYADFERAVRQGIGKNGSPLYPAMPYVSYAKLTDQDVRALYAYFMSAVQPVSQRNHASDIAWPMSMRWPLRFWQMLYGGSGPFTPPKGATPQVARGAYLVEAAGHCGECHTPHGSAFQAKALTDGPNGVYLSGSNFAGAYAPDLRHEDTGLAGWSQEEVADFLKTGRTVRTAAFDGMGEVVEHSTQHLTEADAAAIAAYLASLSPRSGHTTAVVKVADATTAKLYDNADRSPGALGYVASCAACHRLNGQGTPRIFPALAGNSVVTAADPAALIRLALTGGAMAYVPSEKMDPSMPEFETRLKDGELADILTFVRASWGNAGSPVTAQEVAAIRGKLAHKPANYVPGGMD
jgi:mono/diheme cytochrome c family protein